jgi:hypothetical protein
MIGEPNDGVVSVSSQMRIKGAEFKHVTLNHFEVLMDGNVSDAIEEFLEKVL